MTRTEWELVGLLVFLFCGFIFLMRENKRPSPPTETEASLIHPTVLGSSKLTGSCRSSAPGCLRAAAGRSRRWLTGQVGAGT